MSMTLTNSKKQKKTKKPKIEKTNAKFEYWQEALVFSGGHPHYITNQTNQLHIDCYTL
jgi:hypothetical protein